MGELAEAFQLRPLVHFAPTERRTQAKTIIIWPTSLDLVQGDADSIFYV